VRAGRVKQKRSGAEIVPNELRLERRLRYLVEAKNRVRLWTFLTLNNVKFDVVAFFEALVTVKLNSGIVNEDIWAIVAPNEAVTFSVVEPLDFALIRCHEPNPLLVVAVTIV
jgi:hypothetical protein